MRIQEPPPPDEATRFRMEQGHETEGEARGGGGLDARASPCRGRDIDTWAISEFPKGRKYLISLSFLGKSSVRPAQVGRFDVNIVIHGSTAVRGRGDLVAYGDGPCGSCRHRGRTERAHRTSENAARFPRASTGPFPSNHPRKTPKGPKIALGNPDRPDTWTHERTS